MTCTALPGDDGPRVLALDRDTVIWDKSALLSWSASGVAQRRPIPLLVM